MIAYTGVSRNQGSFKVGYRVFNEIYGDIGIRVSPKWLSLLGGPNFYSKDCSTHLEVYIGVPIGSILVSISGSPVMETII